MSFPKCSDLYCKTKRNARVNLQAKIVVFQNRLVYIAKTKRNTGVNLRAKT